VTEQQVSICRLSSRGSKSRDAPSEDLDLHPVEDDQSSVSGTVQGRDVGRPPEEVGSDTKQQQSRSTSVLLGMTCWSSQAMDSPSRGKVSVEEGEIGDSLLRSNVSQRTLVRVVERREIEGLVQPLDGPLDILGRCLGSSPQLVQLILEFLGSGHFGKGPSEVSSLLTGSLSGRSVGSGGTVTEGKDLGSTSQSHVTVDDETSSLSLVLGELGHEVSGDLSRGVSGSPDEETVRDLLDLLVTVLDDDRLFTYILDHGSGKDINLVLLERRLGVLNELLGEGGQDVGKRLDQGDPELVGDFGVPLSQVVDQEIVQLSGVLDTGRTSTDDDHVHQPLNLLLGLTGERGRLDTVQKLPPDPIGILQFLEETSVLLDSLDSERLVLGTNSVDQVVVRDGHLGRGGSELRVVCRHGTV